MIPSHKHSERELSELRARSAMQSANSSIVASYNKKLASKLVVVVGYILPLIAPAWSITKRVTHDKHYVMTDLSIMVIPLVLALMIALFIALFRSLSRHNAAFILVISMLCCFPIGVAISSNKVLQADLLAIVGKELPVDSSMPALNVESASGVLSDDERQARKQALEDYRQEREKWRREQAEKKGGVSEPSF